MSEAIGVVELAEMTGDNRKWIYRNAETIPGRVREGAVGGGRGNGYRFRKGKALSQWVRRRVQIRADAANRSPTNRAAELAGKAARARNITTALESLKLFAKIVHTQRFLNQLSSLGNNRDGLAVELKFIAEKLNRVAEHISR